MSNKKAKSFEDFQFLARKYRSHEPEVLDFPPNLRQGFEEHILRDFDDKIPRITEQGSRILDIGSGCGELAVRLINQSKLRGQELHLVDGKDVLDLLPNPSNIVKHQGKFQDIEELSTDFDEFFDVIICYSVFQYIFPVYSFIEFLHRAFRLLNSGGMMLIGDIPNKSMKFRMLNSKYGEEFHKLYTNSDYKPNFADLNALEEEIDDSIIYAMIIRGRAIGFQSYILPQNSNLAFSNRREDLLFVKY